jgi:hypothetical protein
MKRPLSIIFFITATVLFTAVGTGAALPLPDAATLRGWVQEMKNAPRGPFARLRWFCSDGTILPPKEYACRDHGGGVQHGEWTDQVKMMRDNGYFIANVYADVDPTRLFEDPQQIEIIEQMILERFLVDADDGWIFRQARYYRGALQTEDEVRGGRGLLLALVENAAWYQKRFLVLREAVRFMPHGRKDAPVSEMRQLALSIAEQDQHFENLRNKIHVHPELSDAAQIRAYANKRGVAELAGDYEHLAQTIEEIYQPRDVVPVVLSLAKQIKNADLRQQIRQDAAQLHDQTDPAARFAAANRLLASLRAGMDQAGGADRKLALVDTSLVLEGDLFRSGNQLLEMLSGVSRRQRIVWLGDCTDGLYGIGLLSSRQQRALQKNFQLLLNANPALKDYQAALDYAARVPEWADRQLRFYFSESVAHLAGVEPLTRRYIHDRLRGSLLLTYSAILESLLADAGNQLGIQNDLFDQQLTSGLRGLNAGLARGTLRKPEKNNLWQAHDRSGIYVLPATTEDLPPVAGIITAGKGNILSHVQLLARNLGIPNVAVDEKLLEPINARIGIKVVLAVSPRGVVQLVEDGPDWDEVFAAESKAQDVVIRPELTKLDLYDVGFIPLRQMRATDSGRIAGPKAANLGELKHYFPEAVTNGLVIPFGHFRSLLDQPLEPGGPSVFAWMQQQYNMIQSLAGKPREQEAVTHQFLQRMRDWISNADPGEDFRRRLKEAMDENFGPDGTYGVFVRSDTNVEDLPGFTGAGLNLTVPNVVGFANVLRALNQVWASPFTERAYRWRQAYMQTPEHVYVSVLLLKSVPSDKSGVMVTADVNTGQPGWLTIAVNEGVGGAVAGQTAEELRVRLSDGDVQLLSPATEPYKRILLKEGGVSKVPVDGGEAVLSPREIEQLIKFADSVPSRFPMLQNVQGQPVPADIEFGFYNERLVLFQIRPFLESQRARQNIFLNRLDQRLKEKQGLLVDLDLIPAEVTQ